ncbi:MAG: glycosyltransferase family 39 protein [Nanoarchaeota archaeon]|nr:glycosyltransferase family 39 protein [Nanoarchaeota archaeon]
MSFITILLFFIYTWGLGFAITSFVKNSENFFERNLMRIGIGLGIIPILGVFLNLVHIPLHWIVFLLLSIAVPVYFLFKKKDKINFSKISFPKPNLLKIKKSNLYVLAVFLLFFILLYVMVKGSFVYPWLEDGDSWSHAVAAKYISIKYTAYGQTPDFYITHYMAPYPPGYPIVMGLLHQTSASIYWTLKFFNALIISLGIIFFYFFVKEFTGNKSKALFSAFILTCIPCFLSHFIWSHSLIVILFFPAFYCLEMIKHDKKWAYAAAIVMGSIFVTQPSQSIKFVVLLGLYFIIKSLLEKRFQKHILFAGLGGLALSFMWWYNNLRLLGGRVSTAVASADIAAESGIFHKIISAIQKTFKPDGGSATRVYTFNDFFIAKPQNMINNPIGVGVVLCLLLFIALIYVIIKYKSLIKKENHWIIITLAWLIFTFLGVNSMTFNLPVGLVAFRFWMLFAIPVSILASEGLESLIKIAKKIKISSSIVVIIIIVGILLTSGYQKYTVNTAIWPFQDFSSMDEMQSYLWLKGLPIDTKVLPLCLRDFSVIGMDKLSYRWEPAIREFKDASINKTPEQMHTFLKRWGYEYIVIDAHCIKKFGENETNIKLGEIASSPYFQIAYPTQETQPRGAFIFKVV